MPSLDRASDGRQLPENTLASAASALLASRCFNARLWLPFAASRPLRPMAVTPRAVAPASATVCALIFLFFLSLRSPHVFSSFP